MITEPVRVVSSRRLEALRASQRRLRWGFILAVCLALGFAVAVVSRPIGLRRIPGEVRQAEAEMMALAGADVARATSWDGGLLSAVDDPTYDEFLKAYIRLPDHWERRRYLTAQVLAVAAMHRLDPDLLFALIAAESRFDSEAVSPRGARGLGQMVFATAQAVAPDAVRTPEDLHDVPRGLYATALHLRQLLDQTGGDLRRALRAYYAGAADKHAEATDREEYVARVSSHYAYLKVKRGYDQLMVGGPSAPQ